MRKLEMPIAENSLELKWVEEQLYLEARGPRDLQVFEEKMEEEEAQKMEGEGQEGENEEIQMPSCSTY